jgi:hypothetical protein
MAGEGTGGGSPRAPVQPSEHVGGTASPKKLTAAERKAAALELRKSGATFEQIAATLGCSISYAHKAVTKALDRMVREPADALRKLELERLDSMLFGLWRRAKGGETGAVDRVIKLMERRARLLGLDAPERRELSGPGGGPVPLLSSDIDLSKLNSEQLDQLEAIVKAGAKPAEAAPTPEEEEP